LVGAIDIGGTKIAVGLVDQEGRIRGRAECPTASERGFQDGVRRMIAMLRETAAHAGTVIEGVGIGCTGPVDPFTGALGSVDLLPGWQGGAIVQEISQAFGVSTAMENDADAAGLAEAVWGAGRGKHRFLYVTVGTGIGVAAILDGQLYRGVDGFHPEMGHHVIDLSGPPCYCGARGCWEVLASGPAIEAWAKSRIAPPASAQAITLRKIREMADAGDAAALETMDRLGLYLGVGLANMVIIFCPDMIALGGGVMEAGHLFLDRARQVVRQHCGLVPFDRAELTLASLGADTALAGAAQVWYHRFGTAKDSA
jgi:glucokinase